MFDVLQALTLILAVLAMVPVLAHALELKESKSGKLRAGHTRYNREGGDGTIDARVNPIPQITVVSPSRQPRFISLR
jgi:hypothetical protein